MREFYTLNDVLLIEQAKYFAWAAHASVKQKRKYDGQDYIVHPIEVGNLLHQFATGIITPQQEAAGLLHDVVEDTGITIDQIREAFGNEITDLVGWLTDVSKLEDGNRKVRKQLDLDHTAESPPAAKTIKCADLISNCKSIVQYDPDFARVFLHEKERLLNVMTEADPGLLAEAWRIWHEARKTLSA
jgi:(p)ppGpp synthase/HD superfamily hydrolase